MTGILILLIFAIFAALMFTRKMPALLAVPLMAIAVAALVGHPFNSILKDIISDGVVKLAPAYVAVFAGAMLGRIMMQTGIAEGIIKRAAEFGGQYQRRNHRFVGKLGEEHRAEGDEEGSDHPSC